MDREMQVRAVSAMVTVLRDILQRRDSLPSDRDELSNFLRERLHEEIELPTLALSPCSSDHGQGTPSDSDDNGGE